MYVFLNSCVSKVMGYVSGTENYQVITDVFQRLPRRFAPFAEFLAEVMDAENDLTRGQRELVALRVSAINGCGYCTGSHLAAVHAFGIAEADIEAATGTGDAASPEVAALLDFVTKITLHPHHIAACDIAALTAAGWTESAVEDTIAVAAAFAFMNRLVDGYGVTGNEDVFGKIGPMIKEFGYAPVAQQLRKKA